MFFVEDEVVEEEILPNVTGNSREMIEMLYELGIVRPFLDSIDVIHQEGCKSQDPWIHHCECKPTILVNGKPVISS